MQIFIFMFHNWVWVGTHEYWRSYMYENEHCVECAFGIPNSLATWGLTLMFWSRYFTSCSTNIRNDPSYLPPLHYYSTVLINQWSLSISGANVQTEWICLQNNLQLHLIWKWRIRICLVTEVYHSWYGIVQSIVWYSSVHFSSQGTLIFADLVEEQEWTIPFYGNWP